MKRELMHVVREFMVWVGIAFLVLWLAWGMMQWDTKVRTQIAYREWQRLQAADSAAVNQ